MAVDSTYSVAILESSTISLEPSFVNLNSMAHCPVDDSFNFSIPSTLYLSTPCSIYQAKPQHWLKPFNFPILPRPMPEKKNIIVRQAGFMGPKPSFPWSLRNFLTSQYKFLSVFILLISELSSYIPFPLSVSNEHSTHVIKNRSF